jgi:O-antigen/teichoic acid export membrane protein
VDSLKKRSVDGVIWNLFEKFGSQLIKIVLGIILARLLTPTDYGLIGMITVFIVFANIFVDSGFKLAYIQKKDTDEIDASTIFFFNIFISIIFYGLLWISAPLIANFYQQIQLVELLRVLGTVIIINSFGIMQIAKLTKEVNFRKKTIITLTSATIAGGIGITAALLNFGVWSIVVQSVMNAFILTVGLWIFYKWKPLLIFKIDSLKSFFSFSSWALLSDVIRSVFDNFYVLVIGKYFPAAELGFYTKAKQFQAMFTEQFSKAVSSVTFPVFAQLQDEKVKLKNAMRKFNQHLFFFIAPISAILFVIAKPLFLILLTEKWLPMVPYFQLLLIAGILYPMHATNVQVLSAQGKVRLSFKIEMIKNILKVTNVILMFRYGVIYIIYGEIVLSFLALIINTYYTKRFVNYGIIEQLKDVSIIFVISIVLTILGMILMNQISNDYLKIIILPVFLGGFYLTGMYYFNKKILFDNFNIIKSKFLKSRS